MKPNWPLLWYLVVFATGTAVSVLLASLVVVAGILRLIAKVYVPSPDGWLTAVATIVLGVLPWPGLVILATALIRPRRGAYSVATRVVGTAVVGLIALNEEKAITEVVHDFAASPRVGSVIVVDNGSSDGTAELAVQAGARVVKEERRGYGFACQRALREGLKSGHPAVILCEADRTFRADDIEKLTAYLKHADLVIGSRTHYALLEGHSQLNSFITLGNVFVGKLLQLRYWDWKVGGRVRLTDVGCTYMAFRAEALGRIVASLEVGGDYFVPHLVMVAQEHGLSVVQVPITFWPRMGASKGGNASWGKGLRLGLTMIWHIFTYRVKEASYPAGGGTESSAVTS